MITNTAAAAYSRSRTNTMAQPMLPETKNNNPARTFNCRLVVNAPQNINAVRNHLIHGLVCLIKMHLPPCAGLPDMSRLERLKPVKLLIL